MTIQTSTNCPDLENVNFSGIIDCTCEEGNRGSVLNSRNFEVWPMFLILNVISALEGTFFLDLFYIHRD